MKTFVHLRLKQYIEKHDIIVEKLAKKMNLNKGSLYNYFNGKTEIKLQVLEKFVKVYPTVNIVWLLSGIGQMDNEVDDIAREQNPDYEKICKKCEEYKATIEDLRSHKRLLEQNLNECRQRLNKLIKENEELKCSGEEKRKVG